MTPNITKNTRWISARIKKSVYADLEEILRETDYSTKTEVIEDALAMMLQEYNRGESYIIRCPDCGIIVWSNLPCEDPHDYHECGAEQQ